MSRYLDTMSRRGFLQRAGGLCLAGLPLAAARGAALPDAPRWPWGSGPLSGLPWWSGGWSQNSALERLRTSDAGVVRRLDMILLYTLNGDWAQFKRSPEAWAGWPMHQWLMAEGTPGINIAFRVWPSAQDKEWKSKVLSSWPSADKLSDHAWVSPRVPVGWRDGMGPEEGRALANEVWTKAAEGYFNSKWEELLVRIRDGYVRRHGLQGRKLIWRPFWECNSECTVGSPHNINSASYSCAVTDKEIAAVVEGQSRMFRAIRRVFPESLIHWCPLRKGKTRRDIRLYCPQDVDIIGPDYYDHWPASPTEAEWEKNKAATGVGGGPVGIDTWFAFARRRGKPLGLGEWGVDHAGAGDPPEAFGGDNPLFVRKMLETFAANRDAMAYEVYFNTGRHQLGGDSNPKATAAFREAFAALPNGR